MKSIPTLTLILALVMAGTQLGAEQPHAGERAHFYLAAYFATGYWAEEGDGFRCPVFGDVTETKIAVYVKEANANTMHLAVALDKVLEKYPQLRRSFLLVSDEPRYSSMTEDELRVKLDSLQAAAKEHGITKLSLGHLKYNTAVTRWRNSLGFFDSADVVICIIEPGIEQHRIQQGCLPLRTVKPFYRFVVTLKSKELDEHAATSAINEAISSLSE
jgi:hypothetical protein